jgi:hypothetical protein
MRNKPSRFPSNLTLPSQQVPQSVGGIARSTVEKAVRGNGKRWAGVLASAADTLT